MPGQKLVSVVVEVSDQRDSAAELHEAPLDFRDRSGGRFGIDCDANEFGARFGQFKALRRRRLDIRRVGIRHRLNDRRHAATHDDVTDENTDGLAGCGARTPSR